MPTWPSYQRTTGRGRGVTALDPQLRSVTDVRGIAGRAVAIERAADGGAAVVAAVAFRVAEEQERRRARAFARGLHAELGGLFALHLGVLAGEVGLDEAGRAGVDAKPRVRARE